MTPCNNGFQGINNYYLLLADFCYCQYRILKEITRDQHVAFFINVFSLLSGSVQRGFTVVETKYRVSHKKVFHETQEKMN